MFSGCRGQEIAGAESGLRFLINATECRRIAGAILADVSQPFETGTRDIGHQPALRDGEVVRVVGHPEVLEVVTDPHTFSSAVSRFLQVPNGLDGHEHYVFRALIDRYFTHDRLTALEEDLREVATANIAKLPRGKPVDFVSELGTRFAVQGMLVWLGWPAEFEDELIGWVDENAEATRSGELERTRAAAEHFDDIIGRVLAPRLHRREDPPRDVTDELLRERVDGHLLTRAQLVSILRNWTGGDLGSMALSIGVIGHMLAAHPYIEQDFRNRRWDRQAMGRAIDELLRIDDPFMSNRRLATVSTEVAGCPVHKGDRLLVDWMNANRDSRVFGDPDRYDPEGNASKNIVYGAGPHVCPGRGLSTMELRLVFEQLLDATSDLRLDPAVPGVRAEQPLGGWASAPVVLA